MSYILEGLKKLEQKRRQQEASPQSISFQTQEAVKSSKKHVWPGVIAAALLLNAGIIYFSFERHRAPESSAVPDRKTSAQSAVSPVTAAPERDVTNVNMPVSAATGQSTSEITTEKSVTPTVQSQKPALKENVKPKPPIESAERINRKPVPSSKIVRLNELPEEIRKILPEFRVSAHFYSTDQKARFARINDKILHEGDTLSEGLKVDEINASGTIFSYQGHRFLIGINENK